MAFPKKLLAVLFISLKQNLIIKRSFVPCIILIFNFLTASSQEKKELRANVYRNIARPNMMVKIQTIENGRISETDSAALNNVQMFVNRKSVISYENKIASSDAASYKRFTDITKVDLTPDEVKIVPELHVETGGSEAEEISYRIVFTSLQPFRYNDTLKKFNGKLGFFLLRESGNNNVPISEPVNIEVVSNDVTSISPGHLKISHLNMPSSNVELITDQVSDSASVRVITTSNPEGYTTFLKVKPTLEIFTNRTRLQGYGIQKIPVQVRFIGSNSPDSVTVNFTVGKGTVTPNSVTMSYNSPSTIYLTSEGTGDTQLSASSSNIRSNNLPFRYVFPFVFLLASILGGLTGGFAKYYLSQKRKKFSWKPIIGGILIGLIGAVAYYALGVNLLGLNFSAELNELAVFGLSALCTYFGISASKD